MAHLVIESDLPANVLRCLSETLPDALITETIVGENLPAVIVVEANQILAAFAFGRDDTSYEALYNGFKKLYMSRDSEWSTMDVSFVYCLPSESPPSESFCSRIETDVYFCRKFVVSLSNDIAASLSRLPFFPLTPISGSPLRPPSAQTLLQRANVKAELARFLIVPGARSAQSILTDCLEEKLGTPDALSDTAGASEQRTERAVNQTTLESLTIRNFRAYRKSKTFTFGSAITVLYGPNGFGKTSFFDALDFAVTGGIGRLSTTTTDQTLSKAARHLDSDGEVSSVSLTFRRGENSHTVIRDLSDPKQAILDSKKASGRKEVLATLTGGEAPATDRVDNFVSLFRATHLFSQERQELTQDFGTKCEISGDLVSRMLAFEDYVNGIKKTSEVSSLIKAALARANEEEARLATLADKDRVELARLEGVVSTNANTGAIASELVSLKQAIVDIGIDVTSSTTDTATLRGWRTQLEASIAKLASQGQRLSKALGDLQQVRTLSSELTTAQRLKAEHEAAAVAADNARLLAEETQRSAATQANLAKAAESAVQKLHEELVWVKATKPEYERLLEERNALNATLEEAAQRDVQLRADESIAASSRLDAETTLASLSNQISTVSQRIQEIQSLSRKEIEVHSANSRLKELNDTERQYDEATTNLRAQLEHASATTQSLGIEVVRIENEVTSRETEGTQVKSLLAQLRSHVTDGTCLLCGVDHGSVQALLTTIDARLNQEDPVADARRRLAEKRAQLTQQNELETGYKKALTEGLAQLTSLRTERAQHELVLSDFLRTASSLGIALPADGPSLGSQISEVLEKEQHALAPLNTQRNTALVVKEVAIKASDAATAAIVQNAATTERSKLALIANRRTIERLEADRRRGAIRFDVDTSELAHQIDVAVAQIQSTSAASTAAIAAVSQRNAEAADAAQAASASKKALEDVQRRWGDITASISEFSASLAQTGLSADSSDTQVTNRMSANSEEQALVAVLRDRSMDLEIALDAATTAAALESLRKSVAECIKSIETIRQERSRHEPWGKYFDNISKLLSTQQRAATEQFTREYGPRTAVIQRRLRPVYGFGDLEVSSRGAAIGVRVMRNGEALRPTDYFSQSQVQTLVLGLFLTACSSQTWSAFSSVMMDDPVTHFDDLNTYALLDLISGLLHSPDGARQFVISTCDEKLLQLARQKFRHLKDGAKFYRFSAIGAEGPLVSEIPV
jgi:exonuclease SbcC